MDGPPQLARGTRQPARCRFLRKRSRSDTGSVKPQNWFRGPARVPGFYAVQRTRFEMYHKLAPIFDDYDILICPTLAVPSVKADHRNDDPTFEINGKPVYPYVGWLLTYPFNLVTQCPVASVPSGLCPRTGVPTGCRSWARPSTTWRRSGRPRRTRAALDRQAAKSGRDHPSVRGEHCWTLVTRAAAATGHPRRSAALNPPRAENRACLGLPEACPPAILRSPPPPPAGRRMLCASS